MTILDFKHLVLAELPGNADNLVELHMVEAVKDMCRKTFAYTEILTIPTVIDQHSYALASTIANTKFVSFIGGTYDGKDLDITDIAELEACDSSWKTSTGTPIAFVYTSGGNSVRVYRIPKEIKTMTIEIAIMPLKIISELPEVIENNYIEGIKNYVKWKVYSSDPINDPVRAREFRVDYENDRDNLKREVLTNFQSEDLVQYGGWEA